MSINSLPPELLRHIVEASIPHSYRSATYPRRQRTLSNLCLVSNLFRQIAQPLLLEIVEIETEKDFEKLHRWLSARDRIDADVKTLICSSWERPRKWLNIGALDKLSAVCPAVSALTFNVYGSDQLSLELLSSFRHLSDLHLCGLSFPPTASLTNLRSLTLSGFQAISTFLSKSGSTVPPSLRYLALTDVEDAFRENTVSKSSILARLLPQLEAWSIEVDGLKTPPLWSHEYELDLSNVFKDIQHLRYLHELDEDALEILVEDITLILESPSHSQSLRTIYLSRLPRKYRKVSRSCEGPLKDVEKACNARGIDLVFDEQPGGGLTDSVISQDFWRRMKRQRDTS